ncbi:MAG: T9SS type A sorting domain-containing protein, partial [Bacteroidia bacterium]|nr:T9SS type A sorting domain-containing protein [Bacteroidia bacterium]
TDAPGCTFCDSITIAEDPTGIHALEQNFSMKINPNPASDEITLQLNSRSNTNFIVQIRDKQGKTVMEKSVENNNEPKQLIQISISTLPAGVYSLSCEQDGKIFSSKFVVVE